MDYLNQFSKFSVDFTNSTLLILSNLHVLLLKTFYRKLQIDFLGVKLSQELKFHLKLTVRASVDGEIEDS